jgi:hypothetical protein
LTYNERKLIQTIVDRLTSGRAYRGLFNLLHLPTQQTLAAKAPGLVLGDFTPAERQQAIVDLQKICNCINLKEAP